MSTARHDAAIKIVKRYMDEGRHEDSLACYSHIDTNMSDDVQCTLHTGMVPLRKIRPPNFNKEKVSNSRNPDCVLVTNWPRLVNGPKGEGRQKHSTDAPVVKVEIMDLTCANYFKLQEDKIQKQVKYSFTA